MKEKSLAVELLEKLLRDEVTACMKNDVVQEKKYSERIMESLPCTSSTASLEIST